VTFAITFGLFVVLQLWAQNAGRGNGAELVFGPGLLASIVGPFLGLIWARKHRLKASA
jgi:hypothetical protein